MCAVCNKPVDWVARDDLFETQETRITVGCHGQTETTKLGTDVLLSGKVIEFGTAFKTVALPATETTGDAQQISPVASDAPRKLLT